MLSGKNTEIVENDANRRDALLAIMTQLAKLDERLKKAFEINPAAVNTTETKRTRLSVALTSVADFVSNVIGREYGDHFFELSLVLDDLNIGTTPDLAKPIKAWSRTLDPTWMWCQRAYVAVRVFDLKINGGKDCDTWKKAAKQVAKKYPEIQQLSGAKAKVLATTIYNWHKEFSAKRIKNEMATTIYELGIEEICKRQRKQFPRTGVCSPPLNTPWFPLMVVCVGSHGPIKHKRS
jgi:hypothetical protein